MAKWVKSTVLDDGINVIKNTCTKMHLISAYTAGDSDATVLAATLTSTPVTMASTDFTVAASGSNRTLTVASGKTSLASASSATPNLHIAFLTAADVVLWVTDETSDQAITSGNPITFPGIVYTSNQPT